MSFSDFMRRNPQIVFLLFGVSILGPLAAKRIIDSRKIDSHKTSEVVQPVKQEQVQYQPINASEFEGLYEHGKHVIINAYVKNLQRERKRPYIHYENLEFDMQTDSDSAKGYVRLNCSKAFEMEQALKDNEGNKVRIEGEMRLCSEPSGRHDVRPPLDYTCLLAEKVQIGPTVFDVRGCEG